ncbi:MAG: MoaD/ThiS family protein [Actinobacteria bacterium]|nr:MoaD/ThiS family protein [Actinomycetota bacterium]MCZ6630357.1 MoaD/ThiS family protein [Actinomycetota bacterium]MCZ6739795.1 MoaD/ThiS family protein [Actinomycetota bacterium]
MAKLRLFASLREIAGTARVDIPAATVGDVIDRANEKFGPDFESVVETSRVWLNGEEAALEDSVIESDEVVLLPPVSGGSQPATLALVDLLVYLPLSVLIVGVFANTQSQEIWAAALVAIAAAWALDLSAAFAARGRLLSPLAITTTAAAGALSAHILGGAGYGLTVAFAVAVVLGWSVVFADYRTVDVYAPTLLVSLLAGLATGSMVLSRSSFSPDDSAVDVFLVAVVVGVLLGALVARMPAIPFLDPFSTTAITAVLAAVGAAAFWDLDVAGYLLVGLGVAVALVAGHGLSSMLRTGRVTLTERSPGVLTALDGVVLAAAIYYPLIQVIL